jgi:biotin carboxyl carrier protein
MAKKDKFETLCIQGTEYKTHLTKKFITRQQWKQPNPNHILAFIPGKIIDIFVKEGQKVNIGDKLLILEAMKMKNVIASPVSGTIDKINIKQGCNIPKNEILIEIK